MVSLSGCSSSFVLANHFTYPSIVEMGHISNSKETRKWEMRKMKTAGMEVDEIYSDEEDSRTPELVYVDDVPKFLNFEECSTILRNDIIIEKAGTEIHEIAKRKSVFLSIHPRCSATQVIGEEVDRVVSDALPIHRYREKLMKFISEHQVVVLVGETGCGKSTQVPQYLYQEGYGARGMIGCTQPRRVAATSLSRTLRRALGNKVGHSVRFEDTTTSKTVVKYMTEGILLQELLSDKELGKYSVLLLDEAHERSINLDVCIGLLRPILEKRKELKLVIMSATIQTEKFCSFFGCPAFVIAGRSYPVDIEYLKTNVDDYVEWGVKRILHVHRNCEEGDILLFATGKEDVDGIVGILNYYLKEGYWDSEGLRDLCSNNISSVDSGSNKKENDSGDMPNMRRLKCLGFGGLDLKVLPLYSLLSTEQQNEVFKRSKGMRRCIVSTNIGETSLTIPNIRYVIDCGLQKTNIYNYDVGESLVTTPISRASADQRAGRAGRTRPGMCYRMYTRDTYENDLLSSSVPEIQRANVCNVVLLLLRQGVRDIPGFEFLDSPSPRLIMSALLLLYRLDAVDSEGLLTVTGKIMSELKLDPPLAKMILNSVRYRCVDEVLTIASMLSVEEVLCRDFDRTSPICHPSCDFLTLISIFNEFAKQRNTSEWCSTMRLNIRALEKAEEIKKATTSILIRRGIEISHSRSSADVQKCILSSLYYNIAKKRNKEYICLSNFASCKMHPSSVVSQDMANYVLFYKHMITKAEYIYCCSAIDPRLVLEEVKRYYRDRNSNGEALSTRMKHSKRHKVRSIEEGDAYTGSKEEMHGEFHPSRFTGGIGSNNICNKIRDSGEFYSPQNIRWRKELVGTLKVDLRENLYDRFEKWEDSDQSEEIELTKRNRKARI